MIKNLDKFDKQIYFIKVIIWEACPFRCKYCFVDKDNSIVIEDETLERIIDLLLYSPWYNKLLHLLWGEPLLFWDTIKKWVIYARKLEKKLGKQLDISFCTTGLLFDDEKLKFIDESNIYLAWSIDGPKEIHDRNRLDIAWNGTFDRIISKKEIVLKNIKKTHLGIAMTIDENCVDTLFESYLYLVNDLGFECTINIAPVDGKYWWKEKEKKFIEQIVKVYDYVLFEAKKGRYLFLNAFNKEFRFNMLSAFRSEWWRCLWFYTEAFPTWEILFNPFVNKESDYSHFVVWNIKDENFIDNLWGYIGCKFHKNSEQCNSCKKNYFRDIFSLNVVKFNRLLNYRDRISVLYANKMRLLKKDPNIQEYIELSKNMMYV